jgi:hypothetical protein
MKNDLCAFLLTCLLCFGLGCRTQPPLRKEVSKSKTEFTIPANSVFAFERGTISVNKDIPVQNVSSLSVEKLDTDGIVAKANADAISKFYVYGGVLALFGAFLLWRGHVKAGFIAIGGAILCPLLARFYSSEAAQNIALAAVCIAGALFVAWHILKNRLNPE